MKTNHDKKPIEIGLTFDIDYGIPNDDDPDDALEARCLRDHDGDLALETPHPEEQARDAVLMEGYWMPACAADSAFADELTYYIENGGDDETPW